MSNEERFQPYEELISTAVKNGGMIYGGYVRNVIYPISTGIAPHDTRFENNYIIDIWFLDEDDAKMMERDMGSKVSRFSETHITVNGDNQTIIRYALSTNEGYHIDVFGAVISRSSPVQDFDINHLCYTGPTLTAPTWYVHGYTPYSSPQPLLDAMAQRTTKMLPKLVQSLSSTGQELTEATEELELILEEGWTLLIPQDSFTSVRTIASLYPVSILMIGDHYHVQYKSGMVKEDYKKDQETQESNGAGPVVSTSLDVCRFTRSGSITGAAKEPIQYHQARKEVGKELLSQVKGLSYVQFLHIATICALSVDDL